MRARPFFAIYELVHTLDKIEVKVARQFLKSDFRNNARSKWLFDLIKRSNSFEIFESKIRNSTHKSSANYMLANRLKNLIQESLCSDRVIKYRNEGDSADLATISLKKLLPVYSGMMHSKRHTLSFHQLEVRIIKLAEKYQLFSILCEIYRLKLLLISQRSKESEYFSIVKKVNYYLECQSNIIKASQIFVFIQNHGQFHSDFKLVRKAIDFGKVITKLEKLYAVTPSDLIHNYLSLCQWSRYRALGDNFAASKCAKENLAIVMNSPVLRQRQRIGTCYLRLADSASVTGNYQEAIMNALVSLKYFPSTSFNALSSLELLLRAYLWSGNISKCVETIQKIFNVQFVSQNVTYFYKIKFYNINLLLLEQKFKEGLHLNSMCNILLNDKDGYGIGVRIQNIQLLIEMEEYEFAFNAIEAYRKFLANSSSSFAIRPRDIIFAKLLRNLSSSRFDFQKCFDRNQAMISKLLSDKAGFRWEYDSYEIIPFHYWFLSKVKGGKKYVRPPYYFTFRE